MPGCEALGNWRRTRFTSGLSVRARCEKGNSNTVIDILDISPFSAKLKFPSR